jgi:hypothetical protein
LLHLAAAAPELPTVATIDGAHAGRRTPEKR